MNTASRLVLESKQRPWPLAAALLAAVFTALVVFVRPVDVAYRSPAMHVSIETVVAMIGVVAAYFFFGRYRLAGRLGDLLVALSLLVLAIGSLFFSVLPAALSGNDVTHFSTWAPLMSGLIGAAGFACAAFTDWELRLRRVAGALVGATLLVVAVLIAVIVHALAARLPVVVPAALSPVQGGRQLVIGQPAALGVQLLSTLLFVLASIGFLRRARAADDQLLLTLSTASALGAFAAFNYFLFPSLYSQWVYSGDILRFTFYLLIFVGVARELSSYWRGLARAAVLEERRRIARDLHDGLAQELAFIASQSRLLPPDRLGGQLASAAERALAESRQAIAALTKPLDEPLAVTLARTAEEVATRFGIELKLELEPTDGAPQAARDVFRQIVREATTNAARHGDAQSVNVSLDRVDGRLCLRVRDDGCGFDASRDYPGFGLTSMRDRAASVGAALRLSSAPGLGTTVEVRLP